MSEELVTIEINDQPYEARKGAMLIEVADSNGIAIPRFCYHKKLTVSANCRMCLVEMERSPKPVPACATPVAAGMKFWTRSDKARNAQKAIMEFLLINHPLDCPICDQGGECELQDVSVAYGKNQSQFIEMKRVVREKDIGPLIETAMTRCIQCTRCVRFGEEIAGMREMGGVFRGDRLEIGTYVEKSLKSELSGNIIDICPVGALTAKPSRYKARPWEMQAHNAIAPHDSVGSNIELHTFRKEVVRAVPRENEAVNECWISDRDRFSYQGIYSADRVTKPMVKTNGQWKEVSWQQALETASSILRDADSSKTAALASATSTLEELYLFQRLMRGLNVRNIDHRLAQTDFSDQAAAPVMPYLGCSLQELEQKKAVLLIGSNVRQEQPMLNHRLRKAALQGAKVMAVNPRAYDFNYDVEQQAVAPSQMVEALQSILNGANGSIISALKEAGNSLILLGNVAVQHPAYAALRQLAAQIAQQTGATLGYLAESANTTGAWIAGVIPHRLSAGRELKQAGISVAEALAGNADTFVLLNAEVADFANPQQAQSVFSKAKNVVVITPFADEATRQYATVILPSATFAETSGTLVNAEGRWQSFTGVTEPLGESRPAWKILRVLGNTTGVPEFDWMSSEEVAAELRLELNGVNLLDTSYHQAFTAPANTVSGSFQRIGDTAMYRTDVLVRRASALQEMVGEAKASLNPKDAEQLGVKAGEMISVEQNSETLIIPVALDVGIPQGCVGLQAGLAEVAKLGANFGAIQVTKVGDVQ